jgi:hypothetical protein
MFANRRTAHAAAFATIVLAIAALLWRPLLHLRTHAFGPFERVAQASSFTRVEEDGSEPNRMLTDPAAQMHPWALLAREELSRGRIPLWNPYDGCGEPLVANYQSAVFSLFRLPYYALPFRAALLAEAFLKLGVAATATLLFLRRIGCTRGAAVFGAVAYASSGVLLMLLQHPHSGVLALLPASLYFVELFFARLEQGRGIDLAVLAALAASLGAALLAGHPETFFHCALVVAAYAAVRLAGWRRASRGAARVGPSLARVALALSSAAALGAALGAVQVLPFAEYLRASAALAADRGTDIPFAARNLPLHVFPHLAGSPMDATLRPERLPWPNYQETNTFFAGGVALFCAAIALWTCRRERAALLFAALIAIWAVYGYDLLGFATFLHEHTRLDLVPVYRSHPLWTPSVCFLAALGLSRLERDAGRAARWRPAAIALFGLLALAVAGWGASSYLEHVAAELETTAAEIASQVRAHVVVVGACCLAGVAGAVLLAATKRTSLQGVAHGVLLASVVVTSASSVAGYVPTVAARFVYPRPPELLELQRVVGPERLVILGSDQLVPESNAVYRIRLIGGYDALAIADYAELAGFFFDLQQTNRTPKRATVQGLELFGVRYVLSRGDWVPVDTDLGDVQVAASNASAFVAEEFAPRRLPEDLPGGRVRQAVSARATRDGLDGFAVQFWCDSADPRTEVEYRLVDVASGREVASGVARLGDLKRTPISRLELSARFVPIQDSAGREFRLGLGVRGETARIRVVREPLNEILARGGANGLDASDAEARARPRFDLGYGQHRFERAGSAGGYAIHRLAHAPGRAWLVGAARVVDSRQAAFDLVRARGFRPLEEVVLEEAAGAGSGAGRAGEVRFVADEPGRLELAAEAERDGFLVLAQPHFPGWTARLDGVEAPLLRANYAFAAVRVPAGSHTLELEYDPLSFRAGAAVSLGALALVGALLVLARRRRSAAARPARAAAPAKWSPATPRT